MTHLEAQCQRIFGLRPHQVRHLLETFTTETIAEEFLLTRPNVSQWRRRLGIAPMKPAIATTNGHRVPMGRGQPLRAFA